MLNNLNAIIYLTGVFYYFLGIYMPHARRFRRKEIAVDYTRPSDVALDMLTFVVWQILPLIYIFTTWLDFVSYELPQWIGWVGTAVYMVALWVLARAYADLGDNWSPKIDVKVDQELVTTGIYSKIRHPIYAGIWLWAIALPLLLWNLIAGFGMLVVFAILYFIRVPREEEMMRETFGADYETYMQQTGRLLPKRKHGDL